MAKKIRDIVVKTGEYQDRNTGETKGRWMNVGSLMQNEDDQSLFVILDRTFNPAGVANPENRSSVILSCFKLKERDDSGQGNRQSDQGNGGNGGGSGSNGDQGGYGYGSGAGGRPMDDDEIPFAPVVLI